MFTEPGAPDPGRIIVGATLVGAETFSEGVSEEAKCRGSAFGAPEFGPAGFELLGGFEADIPCSPDVA